MDIKWLLYRCEYEDSPDTATVSVTPSLISECCWVSFRVPLHLYRPASDESTDVII